MTTAATSKNMWTYHSHLLENGYTSYWYLKNTNIEILIEYLYESREEAREACKALNA